MAKVLNLTGTPMKLTAKDGDSCLIPVGESKIADKFCENVPPRVKILELNKPVVKVVAKEKKAAVEVPAIPKATEESPSEKPSKKSK